MKVVGVLIIGAFGHTPDEKHVVDSVLTQGGGPASTGACHNRLPWVERLLPVVRRHAIRISEAESRRSSRAAGL
jgi:hypothetical protein